MPGAIIAIDQDRPAGGTSFGTPGIARNDCWVNRTIRPRSTQTGNLSQEWTLLDAPAGSTAVVANADQVQCNFLPDLPGTYRIQLVTNGGGTGNIQILVVRVRYDFSGVLTNRGWVLPAFGELPPEANYPTTPQPSGNTRGWDETWDFLINDLLTFLAAFSPNLMGDVTGTLLSNTVTALRGRPLNTTAPMSGQYLGWDGTNWTASTVVSFAAGGDLSGTSSTQKVIGWEGNPLDTTTFTTPSDAQVPVWNSSGHWFSVSLSGDVTITNAGAATVSKVHGASVPAAGSLTTGNVLQVSGASALSYGAVNLGGGAGYVTGVLPNGNQAAQSMGGDGSGTTAALSVVAWRGKALDATTMGAPTDAQIPIWVNGSSVWKAISLSGDVTISAAGVATVASGAKGITQLTGDVTAGPGSGSQAATVAKVNGASVPAAGALTTGSLLQVTGASALSYIDPTTAPTSLPFVNVQSHQTCWYLGGLLGTFTPGINTFGWQTYTQQGNTISAIAPTSGSKLNGTRRQRFASTTNANLGLYEGGSAWLWRGDGAGRGGFKFAARLALNALGNTTPCQFHIGVAATTFPTGDFLTDSTVKRVMLVQTFTTSSGGAIPGGTNWQISECDGTTNHLTNTGIAMVVQNLIELLLYCAPNGTIVWTLNDLTAGTTATGSATTNPPSTATFMNPGCVMLSNGAGGGTQLDVVLVYAEAFG